MIRRAYLSLGSNIDPWRHLAQALRLLRALPDARLIAESGWYRTAPWGQQSQPEFLNLAVAVETTLDPRQLLAATQAIENRLGRQRPQRHAPRTIDIDLLLHGDTVLDEAVLCLPHPGLLQRDFMLIPLLEIAPDLTHPQDGIALHTWRQRLRDRTIIERLAAPAPLAEHRTPLSPREDCGHENQGGTSAAQGA